MKVLKEDICKQIPEDEVKQIIANINTSNSRFDAEQFNKLLNQNSVWVGVFDNNTCKALASLVKNKFGLGNDYYLNEIQSFEKGYGKVLLNYLIKNYKLWLLSDPNSSSKLVDYYKSFNLKEIKLNDSIWNKPIIFFTNITNKEYFNKLKDKIVNYYT